MGPEREVLRHLAYGGTNNDLSATGPGQVVQESVGAALTVAVVGGIPRTLSVSGSIPAGWGAYVPGPLTLDADVILEVGADSILEVG